MGSPRVAHFADDATPRRAMTLVAAFALAWVLLEEVVAARLQGHYHLMQIVWCRYAAHLAVLLLLWGWRRPGLLWRTRRPVFQLARSMLMLIMPLSFALAVQSGTPLSLIWRVFWVAPLVMLALAYWTLGDRAAWWQWLAAALGAVATAGMIATTQPVAPPMLLLPVVMALSFSLYVVMTRSLRAESVHANLFYTALGVFLVLTPYMPFIWVMPSLSDAVVLIAIGVVGLVALLALDRSIAYTPVSSVAPAHYVHLLFLAAATALIGGDSPLRRTWLGAALIAIMLCYLWLRAPSVAGARARDSISRKQWVR